MKTKMPSLMRTDNAIAMCFLCVIMGLFIGMGVMSYIVIPDFEIKMHGEFNRAPRSSTYKPMSIYEMEIGDTAYATSYAVKDKNKLDLSALVIPPKMESPYDAFDVKVKRVKEYTFEVWLPDRLRADKGE